MENNIITENTSIMYYEKEKKPVKNHVFYNYQRW